MVWPRKIDFFRIIAASRAIKVTAPLTNNVRRQLRRAIRPNATKYFTRFDRNVGGSPLVDLGQDVAKSRNLAPAQSDLNGRDCALYYDVGAAYGGELGSPSSINVSRD